MTDEFRYSSEINAQNGRSPHDPPRLVIAVCAALSTVAVMFFAHSWVPGAGRILYLISKPLLVTAGLALLVSAVFWLYKSVQYFRAAHSRRLSWWVAVAPMCVAIVGFINLLSPWPSFERSRADFEAALDNFPDDAKRQENIKVGPFDIYSITRDPTDGAVYFSDEDQLFFSRQAGWVYSPNGAPQAKGYVSVGDEFTTVPIDGPWYRYWTMSNL